MSEASAPSDQGFTGEELPHPWSSGEAIAVAWSRVWGEIIPLVFPLILLVAVGSGAGASA